MRWFPPSARAAWVRNYRAPVLAAYREAVAARYRFYSYGDATLIA